MSNALALLGAASSGNYTFSTKAELKDAIEEWGSNPDGSQRAAAESKYGNVSWWNTSAITDMSRLFYVQPSV